MSVAAVSTSGDGIGEPARRRLAGFVRTLRDNGFKIGLAETGDALEILAAPLAVRPSTLKPALRSLFCATHSDWERFDEIFEAFWQGRGIHQARTLAGSASCFGSFSSRPHIETTNPGVQNPHCAPWQATIASCTGLSCPSYFSPSMVTT